jgi:hypothetical protein
MHPIIILSNFQTSRGHFYFHFYPFLFERLPRTFWMSAKQNLILDDSKIFVMGAIQTSQRHRPEVRFGSSGIHSEKDGASVVLSLRRSRT